MSKLLLTDFDLPVLAAVAATIVMMAFLGLSVERLVLRPMENESLLSLVMATIALGIVLRGGGRGRQHHAEPNSGEGSTSNL